MDDECSHRRKMRIRKRARGKRLREQWKYNKVHLNDRIKHDYLLFILLYIYVCVWSEHCVCRTRYFNLCHGQMWLRSCAPSTTHTHSHSHSVQTHKLPIYIFFRSFAPFAGAHFYWAIRREIHFVLTWEITSALGIVFTLTFSFELCASKRSVGLFVSFFFAVLVASNWNGVVIALR